MTLSNQISVFVTQNPLIDKKYPYWVKFPAFVTIADIVAQHKFLHYISFICHVNGVAISRKSWQEIRLKSKDIIVFTYYPLQGDTGKAIARMAVIAAFVAINPASAIGATGIFSSAFNFTALTIGGFVIETILPTPQASQDDFSGFKEPSPTYSIQARSNQIRLGGIIPVQYGKHKIYPDLAAKPFTNYIDSKQYLYLLFCIGMGKFDTENAKIYIEDTPIENYNEYIEIKWADPGQDITLFDYNMQNIDEIGNFELEAANQNPEREMKNVGWFTANSQNTQIDKVAIDIEMPQGLGDIHSNNELVIEWIVEVQQLDENDNVIENTLSNISDISYEEVSRHKQPSSLTEWNYHSSGWREEETRILLSVATSSHIPPSYMQGGIRTELRFTEYYRQENRFCEIRGSQTGSPLRITKSFNLPSSGRWQIRVRRNNDAKHVTDSNRYYDRIFLTGIRGRLANTSLPQNITLLAMKIKASEVLNSKSKLQISTLIQRKLPKYQNNLWTEPQATSSISWALADVLRNNVYGAGLSDNEFDIEELVRLDQVWTNQGDEFNGVFDNEKTTWEALKDIARCGRATPIHQAGKISFCRDSQSNLTTQLFTDRNIIKDSFAINYITASEKDPQNIELEYFNRQTWQVDTVNTSSDANQGEPIKLRLFGCTSQEQATREVSYMSRANRYRRINITFETEREGLRLRFGDIIQIAHELPGWGIAVGDITGYNSRTRKFTLSNSIDITLEQNVIYTIYVRSRTGEGHAFRMSSLTSNQVGIVYTRSSFLVSGLDFSVSGELPHYVIYSDSNVQRAIVRGVFPLNENRIRIEAVIDDARVHQTS